MEPALPRKSSYFLTAIWPGSSAQSWLTFDLFLYTGQGSSEFPELWEVKWVSRRTSVPEQASRPLCLSSSSPRGCLGRDIYFLPNISRLAHISQTPAIMWSHVTNSGQRAVSGCAGPHFWTDAFKNQGGWTRVGPSISISLLWTG